MSAERPDDSAAPRPRELDDAALVERAQAGDSTSFDELVVALFLSGSGAVTLPRRMWDDLRFQIDPTIAAVSTLTIVLTVGLMACAHFLRKRAEQTRTATSSATP